MLAECPQNSSGNSAKIVPEWLIFNLAARTKRASKLHVHANRKKSKFVCLQFRCTYNFDARLVDASTNQTCIEIACARKLQKLNIFVVAVSVHVQFRITFGRCQSSCLATDIPFVPIEFVFEEWLGLGNHFLMTFSKFSRS